MLITAERNGYFGLRAQPASGFFVASTPCFRWRFPVKGLAATKQAQNSQEELCNVTQRGFG